MYQIIAPTLFQHKLCRLPGIGTLIMTAGAAQADFVNAKILPPFEQVAFLPEAMGESVFNEFSAISELLSSKLDETGSVFLKGIGTFTREDGVTSFEPLDINPIYFQSVPAHRVLREHSEHTMLVGDQQTTNFQMAEFFNEKAPQRPRWYLYAAAIGVIAIAVLAFYFYTHQGFNSLANSGAIKTIR